MPSTRENLRQTGLQPNQDTLVEMRLGLSDPVYLTNLEWYVAGEGFQLPVPVQKKEEGDFSLESPFLQEVLDRLRQQEPILKDLLLLAEYLWPDSDHRVVSTIADQLNSSGTTYHTEDPRYPQDKKNLSELLPTPGRPTLLPPDTNLRNILQILLLLHNPELRPQDRRQNVTNLAIGLSGVRGFQITLPAADAENTSDETQTYTFSDLETYVAAVMNMLALKRFDQLEKLLEQAPETVSQIIRTAYEILITEFVGTEDDPTQKTLSTAQVIAFVSRALREEIYTVDRLIEPSRREAVTEALAFLQRFEFTTEEPILVEYGAEVSRVPYAIEAGHIITLVVDGKPQRFTVRNVYQESTREGFKRRMLRLDAPQGITIKVEMSSIRTDSADSVRMREVGKDAALDIKAHIGEVRIESLQIDEPEHPPYNQEISWIRLDTLKEGEVVEVIFDRNGFGGIYRYVYLEGKLTQLIDDHAGLSYLAVKSFIRAGEKVHEVTPPNQFNDMKVKIHSDYPRPIEALVIYSSVREFLDKPGTMEQITTAARELFQKVRSRLTGIGKKGKNE